LRLPGWLERPIHEITSNAVRQALDEAKAGVAPLGPLSGPGWVTWSEGVRRQRQFAEIRTEEEAYKYVSWVHRAVGAIVESTRRASLGIYKPSRREQGRALGWSAAIAKAEGAPLSPVRDPMDLLTNPLRDFSVGWDELFEQTLGHFLLRGWVGWYCPLVAGKIPATLQVVPCAAVQQIIVEDGKVTGYRIRRGRGAVLEVKSEELCVMRDWNPQSSIEGLSRIESVMLTADTDRAQSQAAKSMARRGTYQQGFLTTEDRDVDETEIQAARAQFESRYGGPEEAYRTPVVTAGLKWQKTGISLRELGFLEVRKFNREEIGAIFGVPPIKMGDWSNSYYNSREQARSFWLDAIEPMLKRVKRFIDSQFLPYWERGLACDFDTADIAELQEDRKEQADLAARLVESRIISPNEARADYLGKLPYTGGDAILAQISLMPAGAAPAPPQGRQSEARRTESTADAYRTLLLALGRPRPRGSKTLEVQDTQAALVRWWNLLNSIMVPQARRLGALVQARVNSDFIAPVSEAILSRVSDPTVVLDTRALTDRLAEKSLPLVRAFYLEAGERAEGVAGAKAAKFDLSAARKTRITLMVSEWARNTSDGLIREIAAALEEKLHAGVDLVAAHDEIIGALKELLGSEYRCETCSRTIVQGANNDATLQGWRGSQVVDGKRWLAGPPSDRRRPVHQEMSAKGEVYGLDDDFVLPNGATGKTPGQMTVGGVWSAKENVFCGCVMLAALKQLPSGT